MKLTTAQIDRACGVLLGTAAGDALGAAYEFGPPRGPELEVAMVGGGAFGWEPGEWTDDTSMAIAIAEVAAAGARMTSWRLWPLSTRLLLLFPHAGRFTGSTHLAHRADRPTRPSASLPRLRLRHVGGGSRCLRCQVGRGN